MNPVFRSILDKVPNIDHLTAEEKEAFVKAIKDSDKNLTMLQFKLERIEKDKHTLEVMLEESIEDLQKKSRAIEAQNRELEIEASLEKVRAVAMGIRKRDDMLDVCRTISQQLEALGIREIRNVQTAIFYEQKGTYVNYEYYRLHDTAVVTEVDYTSDEISVEFATQMIRGGEKIFIRRLEGQQVKDWLNFQKTTNVFIDTNLEKAKSLTYHWFSLGPVAIGTSTYEPLTEIEIELFKRFRNVFELAYRRYLDIEKAEAQAKEANIEAALEKVRSKANAMHRSENLREVIKEVHSQLRHLEFRFDSADFLTDYTDKGYNIWLATADPSIPSPIFVSYFDHRIFHLLKEEVKQGHEFFTFQLTQEEKDRYFKHVFKTALAKYEHEESRQFVLGAKGMATSCVVLKNIILSITNFASIPYTEEENNIIKRFAYVFEQSYVRFLDLQKAEAQTRESQIELGLERVRARAMAMQHSVELKDLIATVSEELGKLDFTLDRCIISIIDPQTLGQTWWMSHPESSDHVGLFMRYHEHKPYLAHLNAWRERLLKFQYILEGEIKKEWDKFLFVETELAQLPEIVIATMRSKEKVYLSSSFNNFGYLSVATLEPLSNDQFDILLRFAKVFDLTYTRFNDLKQAEAQGREAQIQLALERVRARTMAMQKSGELADVAELLFKQVNDLGIKTWTTGFNVWSDDNNYYTDYITDPQGGFMPPYTIDASRWPVATELSNAKKRGEEFRVNYEEGEDLAETYRQLSTFGEKQFKSIADSGFEFPSHQYEHFVFGSKVSLMFITYDPVPEAHEIFKRFGKVFEQTYTRFLDLQKAEEQVREAQIEAALEKVRSRSLAMHKSDELQEVVHTVFERLKELNVQLYTAIIIIFKEGSKDIVWWMENKINQQYPRILLRYADIPYLQDLFQAKEGGKELFSKCYVGEEKYQLYSYLFEHTDLKNVAENQKKFLLENEFASISIAFAKNTAIHVTSYSERSFTDEDTEILKRFAKVFDQAYTRFLDLQRAEAQAREAQIEAALERVRSKAMAMHKADDLNPAVAIVFEELDKLNLGMLRCGIGILHKEKRSVDVWSTSVSDEKATVQVSGDESIDIHPLLQGAFDAWLNQTDFSYELYGDDLIKYYRAVGETNIRLPQSQTEITTQYYYVVSFGAGGLFAFRESQFSDEGKTVMKRFANVFNLTYKRFLDLQKAEAQAREGQIQLALERARAQSMIMQHSKELDDTLRVFHEQVLQLNIPSAFSFLWLPDEERDRHVFWAAWAENNSFKSKAINYPLDKNEPATAQCLVDWKSNEPVVAYRVPPAGVENYFAAWSELIAGVEELKPEYFSDGLYYVEAFMKYGCFGVMVKHALSEDENRILERFAIEFERAYTRFLDLQKAEGQAREAEIELALERVRARAMSMQTSEELNALIGTVFAELTKLDLVLTRCVILIYEGNEKGVRWWMANSEAPSIPMNFFVKYADMPFFNEYLNAWSNRTLKWQYVLEGETKVKTDAFLFKETELSRLPDFVVAGMRAPDRVYLNASFNNFGNLTLASLEPLSNEHFDILLRFAKVFDLTYTRFNDLKQAEAQAREAQIEAALERVRSRTLAMQRSDELAETASVLFRQLIALGIEPNRLYINIVKDDTGEAEFWITDEDGSTISMAYSANMTNNATFNKMFEGWKTQSKSLIIDMQGKELQEYFKFLSGLNVPFKGGFSQKRRLQYIAYFGKGFIGMASPDEQPKETMQLLERFAAVFNLTFTRFNDLKIAEAHALQAEQDLVEIKAAKKRAEDTLTELQATQRQLIQSEKMASLGELTAGIAHEIQNPLNFVNNFSDVSNELLEEMKTELEKGNTKDAVAIVDDVKQNLEKILYHGKRADAIVKGMLQHSRTSTSQKELTDINALADEYLRLAYHGLRAKDKSFNAKFNTDFDKNAGKVSIIPQEIGRVILNLINNAFYAVSEKQKQSNGSFDPTVSVSTKYLNDKLLITVADNGNGIPQKNLDKIFQPFFTTKPTGQGTGLGLSLAYDIITKGHNGEIKIETKEGEGSVFIIQLPIN